MKRAAPFAALFLIGAASVHADPVDIPDLPPHPEALVALLLEVLVVAALVRRCKLRTLRFIVAWYGVNLFTYYVLMNAVLRISAHVLRGSGAGYLIAEVAVFASEAAALIWFSRIPYFRNIDSKQMSLGWATLTSFFGNLSSILSFAGIIFFENWVKSTVH